MKAQGRRKPPIVMTCVAVIAVLLLLGACSTSEEQNESNVAVLEARGFIDPVLIHDNEFMDNKTFYDVTVGLCRLTVATRDDGWWYLMASADTFAPQVSYDLSVVALKAHSEDLGLTHCFE